MSYSLKILAALAIAGLICQFAFAQKEKAKLIFSDEFNGGLNTSVWKAEIAPLPNSTVYVKDGQLVLDTKGGVTVWLKKKLKGNIRIEYSRKVLIDSEANDRLSDLNSFWMATDQKTKTCLHETVCWKAMIL